MSKKKTFITSIVILLVSAVITSVIFLTEPEAQQEGATRKTAMLVDVIPVEKGTYRPTIVATGAVQASKDITLSPQVGGEVIMISENFTPGAYVNKGEVLLQIDPADYRNAVKLRESDLQLAKADLSMEMGRQDVARKDYELIGQELSPENRELVLRKPQLEAAKANVESAEAALNQARLNLQRTTIRSPFDAHIISRNTNVGSRLAPGDEIGRLVGMDEYWVVADVPLAKVNWLTFGENDNKPGAPVKIMNSTSWPTGVYRKGNLFRWIGALDGQSRLARVIISVADPLARNTEADTVPPLMIGTFVETHIEAKEIRDVFRLDRDFLRQGQTVWVMKDGKLDIREIDIAFQDSRHAYIKSGLSDKDLVVTTDLSTVVEGSELRTDREGAGRNPESENVSD